ncbi:iron uptake system protein EfeO [Brevibacillus borstelensis]|uniref:iron uptake system protein EfeO n=1 Tax=Brevibacillus borstelensis TaxID=45462 RepID=UPI003CC91037
MSTKSTPTKLLAVLSLSMMLAACGQAGTAEKNDALAGQTPSNAASGSNQSGEANPSGQSAEPTQADQAAIEQYHKFVISQTDQFVKETDAFVKAVKAGDLETAKKLYAPTRMYFERIEPIAESLGDFDPWIDAREGDVPDNEWRGFHRLEKALWVDKSTEGMDKVADQLLQDVKQLRVKVEHAEIDTQMLVTGAVELLNEVSSSKVTGEEERYSHTDLYDFAANVEGAKEIYLVLKPTLEKKDAALAKEIDTRFAELDQSLAPYRKGTDFVLYTELKPEETKKLSQTIDALAEPLSKIGTVLEG